MGFCDELQRERSGFERFMEDLDRDSWKRFYDRRLYKAIQKRRKKKKEKRNGT